jgi:hypothetical protein
MSKINLSQTQATVVFWLLGSLAIAVPFLRFLGTEEQAGVLAFLSFTKGMIGVRAYSLTPEGNVAENPPTKQQVEGMENAAAAKGKNLDGSDKY